MTASLRGIQAWASVIVLVVVACTLTTVALAHSNRLSPCTEATSQGADQECQNDTHHYIISPIRDFTDNAAEQCSEQCHNAAPPTASTIRMLCTATAQVSFYTLATAYLLLYIFPAGTTHNRARIVVHAAAIVWTIPILIAFAIWEMLRWKVLSVAGKAKDGVDAECLQNRATVSPKTVLLTGGKMAKSLHMARSFAKAGHRVIMVESCKYWCSGSRFSNAVYAFETVTCPRLSGEQYLQDLQHVFSKYRCDYFVPVSAPAAAVWDAKFLRSQATGSDESVAVSSNLGFSNSVCGILDDKHKFTELCRSIGMSDQNELLVSHQVQSDADAVALNARLRERRAPERYVLKNLSYDPIHRLDLFCLPCEPTSLAAYLARVAADGNAISRDEPWQAQRFIADGTEYTVYAIIRDSEVLALTTSLCSPSQLRYTHIEQPMCRRWVESFCHKLRQCDVSISGQVCWDFMIGADGIAFPLECNPRVHSQCCAFASSAERTLYADALLGIKKQGAATILQHGADTSQIVEPHLKDDVYIAWIQNEIFYRVTNCFNHLQTRLNKVFGISDNQARVFRYEIYNAEVDTHRGFKDADFDVDDVLPFFMRNTLQPLVLLFHTFCSGNEWKKIDFAIGKVVEKNGD